MNMHKSTAVIPICRRALSNSLKQGIEVLFDDRKERPGVLADMELIGIPHMIIIGEKNLEKGEIEYKSRRSGEKQMVDKQQR